MKTINYLETIYEDCEETTHGKIIYKVYKKYIKSENSSNYNNYYKNPDTYKKKYIKDLNLLDK